MFTDPTKVDMSEPSLKGWDVAYGFLHSLATDPLYDILIASREDAYFAWVLACVVPFSRVPLQNPSGNLKKNPPAATLAAREGIKAPNKVTEVITAAVRHREEIIDLKNAIVSGSGRMHQRDYLGMSIRTWEGRAQHWRLQVLFAMLEEVMSQAQAIPQDGPVSAALDTIRANWQAFVEHLQKLDLMDAPSIKPLMDGKELSKRLNIKPGPWMSSALDVCMAWQLRNPQETDPAGAIEEVRQRKEELGIAGLLKQ